MPHRAWLCTVVRAACLALGIVACLLPAGVLGAEADTKTVRIAYSDFPPYVGTDPDAGPLGFSIDILRSFAAAQGLTLTFVRTANPGETLSRLGRGEVDLTTPLGPTPSRGRVANFSTAVDRLELSLFVPHDSGIKSRDQLRDSRIGVVAGSTAIAAVEGALPEARQVIVRSVAELLMAILSGDIDAAGIPAGPFQALKRRADLEERLTVLPKPLRAQDMTFLVRKDRADLLEALDAEIARLTESGELDTIREKWFGRTKPLLERSEVRIILSAGAVAGLALLVGGGVAWQAHRRANRTFAEVGANRLLIDALNGVDFLIVIYDRNLRAVHWNEATAAHFPEAVPMLERGVTFRELVKGLYGKVRIHEPGPAFDLDSYLDNMEQQLLAGRTEPRLVRSSTGTIFEATDFRIGPDMYASVRKDVTRLETQANDERRRSLMQIEALFSNAAVGLAQLTFEGTMIKVNGKLAEILQCELTALTGDKFLDYVDPDDRPALAEHIAGVLDGRDSERHTEVRMKSCASQPLWANVTLSKVAKGTHESGYLVLCVEDITVRRRTEDQRSLLLGELSHRVKNILAVVQTITMQTLRGAGANADLREKVFLRLRALAAAHDIVFRSYQQDIASVLQSQMIPYQDIEAYDIAMNGPRVELPVDLVYALGLIVHELITNSVKYGALSATTGRVDVRWTERDDRNCIAMRWTETGGPETAPPERQGFGSRLIQQMVGHSRDGSVTFDFRRTGLVVDLTFSLEGQDD